MAAHYADLLLNKSFLDPVTKGRYPDDLVNLLRANDLLPQTAPEDAQLVADGVVDILGVNYYQPRRVKAKEGYRAGDPVTMPEDLFSYCRCRDARLTRTVAGKYMKKACMTS